MVRKFAVFTPFNSLASSVLHLIPLLLPSMFFYLQVLASHFCCGYSRCIELFYFRTSGFVLYMYVCTVPAGMRLGELVFIETWSVIAAERFPLSFSKVLGENKRVQ